ncbi:flagellar export chaperone FlgN [Enterobacteriaceae bacterium LUAb1]
MSNSATEQVKQLLRDMRQDTHHYATLVKLLHLQREAMIACHGETTEDIGRNLLNIYQQLHLSAQRRSVILRTLKLATNSEGIHNLLLRLPAPLREQAGNWWKTLQSQAQQCQQLNERNGILLNTQVETLNDLVNNRPENYLYSR